MNWDYFDKIMCLNQAERPDRWTQAEEEFKRVGLAVERFFAIKADVPFHSFCLSQHGMLKRFLESEGQRLLTLEDDVVFRPLNHLEDALSELPEDWDVLYLGANDRGVTPQRYSNRLSRIGMAWTTHAVAYSRKMAEFIVANYPVETFAMYDDWLSNQLPDKQAFIVNPPVAWQRPVMSDLWGTQADYTGCFEDVERRMAV